MQMFHRWASSTYADFELYANITLHGVFVHTFIECPCRGFCTPSRSHSFPLFDRATACVCACVCVCVRTWWKRSITIFHWLNRYGEIIYWINNFLLRSPERSLFFRDGLACFFSFFFFCWVACFALLTRANHLVTPAVSRVGLVEAQESPQWKTRCLIPFFSPFANWHREKRVE